MGYGIDIGSTALKVIALRRTLGGYKIVGAARRRVPSGDEASLSKLLREALGTRNGHGGGVVGLSGRDINLQVVQQPSMKASNYRAMMGYEVEQRRAGSGDLYVDYCTLREPDSYYPQYLALVGIAKSAYVDERIGAAVKASLDVRDAVPNACALYAAHKNAYGTEGGTILLLDLGSDNMDLAFVRGGRLVFARNVASGARLFDNNLAGMLNKTPAEAESLKVQMGGLGAGAGGVDEGLEADIRASVRTAAGQLSGFITSSISHARLQLNDKEFAVDKIYLSGGGARLRGLPEYLAGALKISVELLDPFKKIDASFVDQTGAADLKHLPTDMAVAIGLAQLSSPAASTSTLSLLPEKYKKRRNMFRTTLFLAVAGAAAIVSLLILTGIAAVRRSAREGELESFKALTKDRSDRMSRMDELESQQFQSAAKVDYILSFMPAPRGVLDSVSKLRNVLKGPLEGVRIRELRLTDPTGRREDKSERQRAAFTARGRGLAIGELESESDQKIKLKGQAAVEKADLTSEVLRWPAELRAVLLVGEVDENIRGTPREALNTVCRELTDPARGVAAKMHRQSTSADKTGWRTFEILVNFE